MTAIVLHEKLKEEINKINKNKLSKETISLLHKIIENGAYSPSDEEIWDIPNDINELRINTLNAFRLENKKPLFPKVVKPLDLQKMVLPRDFVISGLKAGSVGAIIAPGGTGKSFLSIELAISIITNTPFANGVFDVPTVKGKVAMVFAEDDLSEIQYRQALILDNLYYVSSNKISKTECEKEISENLEYYSADEYSPYLLRKSFQTIETTEWVDWLKSIAKGKRLLILDPLSSFFGLDENDSIAVNKLIVTLRKIARETNCAILLVHHTNKASTLNEQGHLQGASRGSSALVDGLRWMINLCAATDDILIKNKISVDKKDDFKCLSVSKSNYGKKTEPVLLENMGGLLIKYNPNDINPKIF